MSEYKHGSMDVTHHERTFAGFLRLATIVASISVAILVFLAVFNS